MATFSYIRVSTDKQDYENQKHGILDFANNRNMGKVEFVEETVSGKVCWQHRELGKLIERMEPGDSLVISELSRLGRNMLECMELLSVLTRNKITVYVVKGSKHEFTNELDAKVMAFAYSLAAEIERDLISQRTKEALAKKAARGEKLGRPVGSLGKSKLDAKKEQIIELLNNRVPVAAIARVMGLSRTTLLDYIKTRELRKE